MIILIYLLSVAAVLGIFYMFKVPFIPFKDPYKEVLFNLFMAVMVAALFDKHLWIVAGIVLCGKLLQEKFMAWKNGSKPTDKPGETK